jgi:hypothetical protein
MQILVLRLCGNRHLLQLLFSSRKLKAFLSTSRILFLRNIMIGLTLQSKLLDVVHDQQVTEHFEFA